MIDLYTWTTPNGRKVSIALEEMGLPYTVHPIDIGKDQQFTPDFLAVSPNNKIPAIYDQDHKVSVFESGAILIYLAEKSGQFLSQAPADRARVLEWLMWQMGGVGPMAGQAHHFLKYAPQMGHDITYAKDRYRNETARLYGVLDRQLAEREFVAGDYSIADMAIWPWASLWEGQQQTLEDKPHLARWLDAVGARPGVKAGRALHAELRKEQQDKKGQETLFQQKT